MTLNKVVISDAQCDPVAVGETPMKVRVAYLITETVSALPRWKRRRNELSALT